MAKATRTRQISRRLVVTPKTVEEHVRHIFQTLRIDETPEDHGRVLAVLAYLRSA